MIPEEQDVLMHYGMPRRSGRYPWGSGDEPYQHSLDFIGRYEDYKKRGMTESQIAAEMGILNRQGKPATSRLRAQYSVAITERRMYQVATIKRLKNKEGLSNTEIGRRLGINESSVRSLLKEESQKNMNQAMETAKFIEKEIKAKRMVDVGTGVNRELNISQEKLNQAVALLEEKGYPVYNGRIEQVTNRGKWTTQKVICDKGTEYKEIYEPGAIKSLNDYVSHDGGQTFDKFVYPKSLDSSRMKIRYADEVGPDGAKGIDKDGIVEIRRGVADLSLGGDHYSQVRIMVDGKHYIKGMAVYSDNLPKGVDVVFNTNKTPDKPLEKVLKPIKDDPDNPFGSLIKAGGQSYYTDKNGERQLSIINKTRGEGDWSDWADALPSQFLGKQSLALAKQQLGLAKADKLAEFEEIRSLENPTIKKHLLDKFASECDSAAVHLKAAALPGQKYHVIIPINTLKDNEVYAPRYADGTKLALIRYPHGGTFEIPILTVNNKHKPARDIIGTDSFDAVGINKKNADRLSGADFDGDTVMCIPTHDKKGRVKITSTNELEGLKGFDPKEAYPERPGMRYMKDPVTGKDSTQMEMGKISNLITDMTLAGAGPDELARAVRHSMVVIDAGKHKLDYRKSEMDNNIQGLKEEYQRTVRPDGTIKIGGASTLLSRSKSEQSVDKRQGTPIVNMKGHKDYDPTRPEGSLIYKTADDVEYTLYKTNKRTGEVTTTTKRRKQQSTKMAETDDANTLVSSAKHPMELVYADYANSMKSMANQARKEMMTAGKIEYSSRAKSVYKQEYDSLMKKLNEALLNSPKEREAQRLANYEVEQKKLKDPNMSKSDIKKASQRALSAARQKVGSVSRRDRNIDITDREWEAIQAGAISENKLKQILDNADTSKLRQLATPRATTTVSPAKQARIQAYRNSNYTLDQIAEKLGLSKSTVSKYLKGE